MIKLFVGTAGKQPAIASYRGDAKLSTWLQVVARRCARDVHRHDDARRVGDDRRRDIEVMLASAIAGDDVPQALKASYLADFKRAFQQAFETLSTRERTMLRYELVDKLSRDQIGRVYGVSRATVGRWRRECRDKLYEQTRANFEAALRAGDDELDSVMRLIESQLEVSLSRLLGKR